MKLINARSNFFKMPLKNLAGYSYLVSIRSKISGLLILLIKPAAQILLLKAVEHCME